MKRRPVNLSAAPAPRALFLFVPAFPARPARPAFPACPAHLFPMLAGPHPRSLALRRSKTRSPRAGRRRCENRAVERHAHECDDGRLPAADFAPQRAQPGDVFVGAQRVDPGRHAGDEIRDAEPPFRQPVITFRADPFGHEPGLVQQLPESIRIAGEMMSDRRGSHAGIDADEQHPYARPNTIT